MTRVIVLFSLAGAPGTTTLSTALAAAWPEEVPTLLVEADASGGDVAAWHRMAASPGLVELAAASRSTDIPAGSDVMAGCTQLLPGGQRVCPAPSSGAQAGAAVDLLAGRPEVLRAAADPIVVVDAGRLAPRSAAARLAAAADAAVLVVSDDLGQLRRARDALPGLHAGIARLGLAVVGGRESSGEIVEALDTPVWARIPHDGRGAGVVRGESAPSRRRRRSLFTAARALARALAPAPEESDLEGEAVRP
ncbi:hypothetical protein [Nocardiopsis coralliicola]